MNMLILAAGAGTRLGSNTHKSLVKFRNGKSSLEMLMDYSRDSGKIEYVVVVTGYDHNNVTDLLINYTNCNVEYNKNWLSKSNVSSMSVGLKRINKANSGNGLLVIDADTVIRDQEIFNMIIDKISINKHDNYIITCDKVNSISEWVVESDSQKEVRSISTMTDNSINSNITSGIVYLSDESVAKITKAVDKEMSLMSDIPYWDVLYTPEYNKKLNEEDKVVMKEIYIPGHFIISEIDDASDIVFINKYVFSSPEDLLDLTYCNNGR